MAVATSIEVTSTQGAREDLSNQLKRIQPHETPLYSTLPQSQAPKAITTDWLVDDLPLPAFGSPEIDGVDKTFDSSFTNEIANRLRLSNKIQRFDRSAAVSPLAEMIDVAGPQSSLLAASKARTLMTLKTDIEACIGSNQVFADADPSATPAVGSKLQGLFAWSDPDATTGAFTSVASRDFRAVGAGVTQDGTAGTSRYDATTNGSITEASFNNLITACFEASGRTGNYKLFCGPELLQDLTNFSRAVNAVGGTNNGAAFNVNSDDGTLRLAIVKIITSHGEIDLIPDLFLNRTSGQALGAAGRKAGILIPNDDNVSLKFMENINVIDLPNLGGGERFVTRAHLSLCVGNPRGLGSII